MRDEAAVREMSVVAGIVWREGRVLVCRRPEDGHMPGHWEFPGGKVEPGESPREALRREIREELGVAARVGRLRWKTHHRYPDRGVRLRFYDCEWESGTARNLGVSGHEWARPSALGDFDFLPADAPLVESLVNGEEVRDSEKNGRSAPEEISAAYDACRKIVDAHPENFPVASRLLPPKMRPHVLAVYTFCRSTDDISDATAPPAERLARLDEWEEELVAAKGGAAKRDVFAALSHTIRRFDLPLKPFQDLLSAFRQDVTTFRYPDYEALLDYCRRSAHPVGRIYLMLHGTRDADAFRASDAICTGLQIANHLQDIRENAERGLVYMPQDDMRRFGACDDDLLKDAATPQLRALLVHHVNRTKRHFREGLPLFYRIRGRAGREFRAIWRGGVAALDAISREKWDVCAGSPKLTKRDKARSLLAAFRPIRRLESLVDGRAEEELNRKFCLWLVRQSRSNFYLSFFTLPEAKRRAIIAVYAYCRMADDIADEPGDAERKKTLLREWREAAGRLEDEEEKPAHPIIKELARAARRYDLPQAHFEAICDGVAMDLEERGFEEFRELEDYCDKVASAVGLACLGIFGAKSESAKNYAVSLGRALQMTNILRDVWEDAGRGRVYLPRREMEEYGATASDLKNKKHTPQVESLLRLQAGRARGYYERAAEALRGERKENLLPARIMGRTYGTLLQKMDENRFRHMDYRPSLTLREKLQEALGCLLES